MSPVERTKKSLKSGLFRYSFWLVLIIIFLFWFFLLSYQKFLQYQTRQATSIESETGIDSLFSIDLGDVEQWLMIRGKNRLNPFLLVLHGGPGAPLFPFARDLGWHTGLENHFTMIYWEQRGTAKSFHNSILPKSMTLQQMNADALELVRFIQQHFQASRIYLLARSWGSVLGIKIVSQKPDWFYAYISIGQLVVPLKSDRLSYEHTLRLAAQQKNEKAIRQLNMIEYPPYDYQELLLQRKWLSRLTKNQEQSAENLPADDFFKSFQKLLATPEYSLWDILAMGSNPYFSLKHLWNKKFYQINLIEDFPDLKVPVYFFCGRKDHITSGLLVEEYYQKLETSQGKSFIWFDNSGHQPEYSEPQKFYDIMINRVKPETYHP